jgi:hypothetical protein
VLRELDASGGVLALQELDAGRCDAGRCASTWRSDPLALQGVDAGGAALVLRELDAGGAALVLRELDASGGVLALQELDTGRCASTWRR